MRRARRRGRPVPLGQVIGRVLGDLGLDAAVAAFRLAERWEEIVGVEVARHCRPVAMRGDVLELEVDTSVWCQELQLASPELLQALRRALADEAPAHVRFRVGYTGGR